VAVANRKGMYIDLVETIRQFDTFTISDERKAALDRVAQWIAERREHNLSINLNFICTHNSRRSHLGQIWAQVMAAHYGVIGVTTYSGGTEATAVYPMIIETINSQGLVATPISSTPNPVYAIRYDQNSAPIVAFSKKYDDEFNPVADFAAVMTCSSADLGCPVIIGADLRIPITYQDPKVSDGTDHQPATYLERSVQIGTEMKYVFQYL